MVHLQSFPFRSLLRARAAADAGLLIIEKLVKNDRAVAQSLGFHSADEATVANMKIAATPLAVLPINLDRVKNYRRDEQLSELFNPTDQFIYPVTVGGKVRSAITVMQLTKTGAWKAVGFGAFGAPLIAEELNVLDSAFIVYAPDRFFLGTLRGEDFTLLRLTPDSKRGILKGKPKNARMMIATLQRKLTALAYLL